MPTCQSCQNQWSWKQTVKRSFIVDAGMDCPYCNEKQYYSSRFKKISTIVPFSIIALLMTANLIFGPSYIVLIALIALIPLLISIYPLFVEFSNEEDPMF